MLHGGTKHKQFETRNKLKQLLISLRGRFPLVLESTDLNQMETIFQMETIKFTQMETIFQMETIKVTHISTSSLSPL